MTHSNCSLSFAFAYLYLERLSEEQHRNTCSEAHEQNRCQEAGEHRLLALGSDGLEVHVDADAAMAMPSTMYAKSTSCGVMEVTNGTKVPISKRR